MAKGKDKPDKKGKKEELEKEEVPVIEEKIDLRNVKIHIEKVEHIEPAFTATDIFIQIKHSDILLGESEKISVLEKASVSLDYEIELPYNVASEQTLDDLLTNPVYFTVWQVPGEADIALYPSRSETSEDTTTPAITKGSITSLYEAILGVKWEEEAEEKPKSPGKVKIKDNKKDKKGKDKKGKDKKSDSKSSKGSKDSKSSKDSKGSKKGVTIDPSLATAVCVGCCNLDLLPLFLGETEINERIPLYQEIVALDDEIVTNPKLPQLTVKITMDNPIFGVDEEDRKLSNLFGITVESIYSLPEFFYEDLDYKIATLLPTEKLTLKPICIHNGVFKEGFNFTKEFKLWPNLSTINNFSSRTPYKIDEDVSKIKNKIGASIKQNTLKAGTRITWNILKKCWLTENGTDFLQKNIIRYRRWPIEIFLTPKGGTSTGSVKGKKGSKESMKKASKDSKSSKGSKESGKKGGQFNPEFQHLMGFVDISSILYPGVTKTRVACELRTFQQKELTKATGFDDSYFAPKPPPAPVTEKKDAKGKGGKEDKKGGKSKDNSSKKSGKDKKSEKSSGKEPEPEPEPEPSQQIFSESGEPTFIILEFELMNPFQKRRTLDDLTYELLTVIPHRNAIKPSVFTVKFATEFYRETIIKLASEINVQYQQFSKQFKEAPLICFIKFLQQSGMYQTYFTTFARAVLILVKEKFSYNNDFKNPFAYINYVSNVYTYLQNILNTQIHEIMSCQLIDCHPKQDSPMKYLYLANEAIENNAISLAERYHLQVLNKNINNPDSWLNLAVFYLEIQNMDKAFECLKEILAIQLNHKYGLLLFGIMLFERKKYYLCESTFMSLVAYHPRFLEGWVCLYLFYTKRQHYEGCDYCAEIIDERKNSPDIQEDDYIRTADGLAWTKDICNSDNVFYQTALILIKLRALTFADMALSGNNFVQDGVYKYYQAVILYFAKDYDHALMHLADAQKMHGPDYAVNSLIGHCHYRLGNYQEAKEAYEFIVESFNRPDDMHMLYMNLAYIYEAEQKFTLARKYMVYVCKYSPTPYSWLMLGILFYKNNSYENAEACLEESNLLDIRLPETWAYLFLINIKFGKNWDAQQCYSQMQRFNLKNEALLNEVEDEMQKIKHTL